MHGLIFTSFLQFTRSHHPERADAIWAQEPQYLITQAYPDEDFMRVFARACELTGDSTAELQRVFGRFAAETTFLLLYPAFYDASTGTRDFLLHVEATIHDLVRATIPGAAPPSLHVVELGAQGVSISYTSSRGLCELLHGLVTGIARHYGESFAIEQAQCIHRGDTACVFFVTPA